MINKQINNQNNVDLNYSNLRRNLKNMINPLIILIIHAKDLVWLLVL